MIIQSLNPSEIILIFWFWYSKIIIMMMLKTDEQNFSGFFDEYKVQKNSIYLKYKYFVISSLSLLSLLINLNHAC